MDVRQLREHIVRPTLKAIGLWSRSAEDLIVGTAIQESQCKYIRQIGCTGAIGGFGLWQMEIMTARDIYDNYLRYNPALKAKIESLRNISMSIEESLMTNLAYACAMCRVHYYRVKEAIPMTVEDQAEYWKKYYNTKLGKGTAEQYIENWNKFAK